MPVDYLCVLSEITKKTAQRYILKNSISQGGVLKVFNKLQGGKK